MYNIQVACSFSTDFRVFLIEKVHLHKKHVWNYWKFTTSKIKKLRGYLGWKTCEILFLKGGHKCFLRIWVKLILAKLFKMYSFLILQNLCLFFKNVEILSKFVFMFIWCIKLKFLFQKKYFTLCKNPKGCCIIIDTIVGRNTKEIIIRVLSKSFFFISKTVYDFYFGHKVPVFKN